ncbi:MAG: NAD(P)/FAD-dependent oxidoreductase [Oscillospiraceae bacterium]|nr:NAD(P)/FAD-dependent oxidoreductase [Oscillospiraceae bacterium]
MRNKVDVAIIGSGEAGIYAAYELSRLRPELKVLVLEKGRDIYSRSCPIVAGKVKACIQCGVCDTMCGFGGAGAFSDGKFNFTTAFGGWLTDFMDAGEVMDLIGYVDEINVGHGATTEVYSTETPAAKALSRKALEFDLHLLQARCKHLGTENNLRILQNIYEGMKGRVEFRFQTGVEKIERLGEKGYRLITEKGDEVDCDWLIAGPGRSGAEWFANECKGLGIELINNQVDIGVRVELPATVFEHITDVVYESKLVYRTKQYGDQVRTFCMNPYGHVVAENVEGINTVNGHSYADPKLQSQNTNFALLVSNRFTSPFNEPYRYGKHIASLSNMLAGGVLVQRFGDLVNGIRTNEHRLSQSFTRPTLTAAVPGDLSLALPKRQLDDIIEMICQLDKLAPGTANYDTLLYGAEVKFYSSRLSLSGELETALPQFFAIGDGAGVTRGLAQAGASGVKVARVISRRLEERK